MKNIIVLFMVLVLGGCAGDTPPLKKQTTSNGYEVQKLFSNEGCNIYRFEDASHYRYYTTCKKSEKVTTSSGYNQQVGKSVVFKPEEINTN